MISFTVDAWASKTNQADDIGLYVQECGGYFHIHRHVIEFFVPEEYRDFMLMKYPQLEEVDYII
jgi:hypothetical protein